MRRPHLAVLLFLALAIPPATVVAQDASPAPDATDPFVGAWLIDTDPTCDCPPSEVVVVGPGGTLVDWNPDSAGYGTWASTGERTADVTFVQPTRDEQGGFAGFNKIRSSVEIAPDGESFTGTFTVEFPPAMAKSMGMQAGEYGPGTVTGQRIDVEPMGTPIGPLPQEPQGPEASPAASPAG